MARRISTCVLVVLMMGCAASQKSTFSVLVTGGDVLVREIGCDVQRSGPGTKVDVSADIPIEGIPIPINIGFDGQGLWSGKNVEIIIEDGTLVFERAVSGTQYTDVAEMLEKVFVPGDPFGDRVYGARGDGSE